MNDKVKSDMVKFLECLENKSQLSLDLDGEEDEINTEIEDALKKAMEAIDEFNDLPMSASGIRAKEEVYKSKILNNPSLNTLKDAFDEWCAIWFWPADQLDNDVPMPTTFHKISKITKDRVKRISNEIKFFHWELEFPDVFVSNNKGFSAIVGNPPWDMVNANSKEYFSSYNPIYRTYDKQKALKSQKKLFGNKDIEWLWISENMKLRAMYNWVLNVTNPYEIRLEKGKRNDELHSVWSEFRKGRTDYCNIPFKYQGAGDANKYKLFLEKSFYLVRDMGRLGIIVPGGLYSDSGTDDLRSLLINNSKWEWLFSFENKDKIFDIHSSFKFCIIILSKESKTKEIKASFMNHSLENWNNGEKYSFNYDARIITNYSPNTKAFLEICNYNDMKIVNSIYKNGVLFENLNSDMKAKREFNMTDDSSIFQRLEDINESFINDQYGRWINDNGDILLPLYQGSMINQLDYAYKKWIEGSGLNAKWLELDWDNKKIYPQFLVDQVEAYSKIGNNKNIKIFYRAIARNTDTRTMLSAITPHFPSGNSLNKLELPDTPTKTLLFICQTINSFVFDYLLRFKCVGTNLNPFILKEMPVLNIKSIQFSVERILRMSASLQLGNQVFAKEWLEIVNEEEELMNINWYSLWAITEHERLRLRCILDAVIAELYGLDYDDLAWILKDDQTDPKGFWRVDKDKPINMRHTTLTLEAFKRLKEVGIESFLEEDWQLPEYVAEAVGPKFLDWQLEKTPKESWLECHEHARKFLGDKEYEKFINGLES